MTRKRTGTPWMPAPEFARTLTGLTVNLLVRDVAASLPFYTEVLGLRSLYSDEDFAALEGPEGWHMMLHADHTLDHSPTETARLSEPGKRGTGAHHSKAQLTTFPLHAFTPVAGACARPEEPDLRCGSHSSR